MDETFDTDMGAIWVVRLHSCEHGSSTGNIIKYGAIDIDSEREGFMEMHVFDCAGAYTNSTEFKIDMEARDRGQDCISMYLDHATQSWVSIARDHSKEEDHVEPWGSRRFWRW